MHPFVLAKGAVFFLKSAILVVTSFSLWVPGLFSWLPICTERSCEDVAHNATFTAFVCAGCSKGLCALEQLHPIFVVVLFTCLFFL